MKNYLINFLLLNAYKNKNSEESFLKILKRENFTNKFIEKTNKLKSLISKNLKNEIINPIEGVKLKSIVEEISNYCKGYELEQRLKYAVDVDKDKFLLFGKCPFIKQNKIISIKYTNNYQIGKYQTSFEHKILMACLFLNGCKTPCFQYIVSDYKNFWIEDYNWENSMLEEIKQQITNLINYMKSEYTYEPKNLEMVKVTYNELYKRNWEVK